jgi:hypothetical protein
MEDRDPPGFAVIRYSQTLFGLCHFNYSSGFLNFWTLTYSISNVVLAILLSIPCLFVCSFEATTVTDIFSADPQYFSIFLSSQLMLLSFSINVFAFLFRGKKLRQFFKRVSFFCRTFHLELQAQQETRLLSTSLKLSFLAFLAASLHVLVYAIVYLPDLYDTPKNMTLTETRPAAIVQFPQTYLSIIEGIFKFVTTFNSFASVIVTSYSLDMVGHVINRFEVRLEKIGYLFSRKTIEGSKIRFLETENILKDLRDVLGTMTAISLTLHYLIHILGIVQLSFGFLYPHSRKSAFHGILNAVIGIIPLYWCCKFMP